MNVCFRQTVRGRKFIDQVPSCYLCFCLTFLFLFFFFLKKKTTKNPTAKQKTKNITMPLNKRCSGKQWILRTYRKAGISWYIPAFVGPAHHIRERRKKMRTCMGKVSFTVQYLLSSLGILIPLVQGFLSVRGLEGLDLRIWYCMSVNCM